MRIALILFAVILTLSTLWGCDPCKKMSKSRDLAQKDSAAFCYYDRKQYQSAAMLFEELLAVYPPGSKAENTLFYMANSKFLGGELITASFLYNEFLQRYPSSIRSADVHYQLALCYVGMTNEYLLDQKDTYKAIERLQLFIELFPNDKRIPEVTTKLDEMRDQLALKEYSQADLYLKIYHYQSAVLYFQKVIQEYPDSRYREASQYKLFKAQAYFAEHSIVDKKLERFKTAEGYYLKFIDKYPNSKYIRSAENLYALVQKRMKDGEAGLLNEKTKPDKERKLEKIDEKDETGSKPQTKEKTKKEKGKTPK